MPTEQPGESSGVPDALLLDTGRVGRGAWRVRALLAVLAGGLLVHELRYRLAGVEVDQAAHGYMPWLQLVVGVLVVAGVVEFAVRLARLVGRGPDVRGGPPPARVLWPVLSVILLVLVAGQEAVELRWLGAHDDHELLGGLLAHGGWLIVPLSVLVGGLCALVLRGAAVLARAVARTTLRCRRSAALATIAAASGWRPVGRVLARRLAGRGPPLLAGS